MTGELYINNFRVDIDGNIPFPFNMSIADYKEPNKRKRSSSKQVALPDTKRNRSFFSSAYNISISDLDNNGIGFEFDPTIKYLSYYEEEGKVIFIGLCQLMDVTINQKSPKFNINLYANFVDLFQTLRDLKVSELGWSEYDHELNFTNIINSWATSVIQNGSPVSNFTAGTPDGFGYIYPIADYGYSGDLRTYLTNDIFPHIYLREFMVKCFELLRLTITGNFIDSDIMKKMIFGFGGGEKQTLNSTEVAARRSQYSATGSWSDSFGPSYVQQTLNGQYLYNYNLIKRLTINDSFWSSSTIVSDTLSQFDEDTGLFTIAKRGNYQLFFTGDVDFQSDLVGSSCGAALILYKNGVPVNTMFLEHSTGISTFDSSFSFSANTGDLISVEFKVFISSSFFSPLSPDDIADKTVSLENSGVWSIDLRSIGGNVIDGDTIYLSNFIPEMKAADLLFGIITAFNLYIDDPDIEGNTKIETIDDFYLNADNYDDFSDLIDYKKEVKIFSSSLIKGKNYIYKFAEDNDFWNRYYRDKYGVGYGDKIYTVQSTFQKGDVINELPWSNTVPVEVPGTNIVIPTIITKDEFTGAVSPFKGKPRVYLYSGLRNSDSWKLVNSADGVTSQVFTSYPCCNHLDDLDNPTFDLNFEIPPVLQWSNANFINVNLFSEYQEKPLRETTGKDSKIIRYYVHLNNTHIRPGSFKKMKDVDGTRLKMNEIIEYDGNGNESTLVEFIRVVDGFKRRPSILEVPHDVSNVSKEDGGNDVSGGSVSAGFSAGEKDSVDVLAPIERG